eukprot:TRINITY_DN2240_c0_g5_i2.p1 TRINITY_DN2240_c0_g5~~TRINITY_DN2240_c0_g5_i2.p1  ORF type:complete len:160 (+),score=28.40 TRINITY_DN2240_c0_g5_i2:49-480(+)
MAKRTVISDLNQINLREAFRRRRGCEEKECCRLDLRSFIKLSAAKTGNLGRLIPSLGERLSSLSNKHKKYRRPIKYKMRFRKPEIKEEVMEHGDYMRCIKKDMPKLNMWEYTLGDKINILENVIRHERKKLQEKYNDDYITPY